MQTVRYGFLGYNSETKEVFIPNKEIIGEFENTMSTGGWPEIMRILKASEKLLCDTLNGDEESVAKGLDTAHTEAASILTYNDENSIPLPARLDWHITAQEKIISLSENCLPDTGLRILFSCRCRQCASQLL